MAAALTWGQKATGNRARLWAARHQVPVWTVEDGFVRSVGLGALGAEPFGFVMDRLGAAYDAAQASDLEVLLNALEPTADDIAQGLDWARRLVVIGASKYNHDFSVPPDLAHGKVVLVVDQTVGDLGVQCAQASAASFQHMLMAALSEHPEAQVAVLTHPDVLAGKRRGYLPPGCVDDARVQWISGGNTQRILAQVQQVYVVSSGLGFEALWAGKHVTCFGVPWYVGWGITDDRVPTPDRRARQLEPGALIHAALGQYQRSVDPVTGLRCSFEQLLKRLEVHLSRIAAEAPADFLGFSLFKRPWVRRWWPGARFVGQSEPLPAEGLRAFWNGRGLAQEAQAQGKGCIVEDGFLRSKGLGSDGVAPLSLIVDPVGFYYDARRPSALSQYLSEHEFSDNERQVGSRIIQRLRETLLGKYNVGNASEISLASTASEEVILVPGQVPGDKSLRFGGGDIDNDAALMKAVRADFPKAFLVYKPHPDVESGNRLGCDVIAQASKLADETLRGVAMRSCWGLCDKIAVMTSLAGFEGLVQGKSVITYGRPFYAGWGLTDDRCAPIDASTDSRGMQRSLEELVYASLEWYPMYRDPISGFYLDALGAIELLENLPNPQATLRRALRRGLLLLGQTFNVGQP
jgi:capsular polysaccharide export protein